MALQARSRLCRTRVLARHLSGRDVEAVPAAPYYISAAVLYFCIAVTLRMRFSIAVNQQQKNPNPLMIRDLTLRRTETDCLPAGAKAPLIGQLPKDGQDGRNRVNIRTWAEWKSGGRSNTGGC